MRPYRRHALIIFCNAHLAKLPRYGRHFILVHNNGILLVFHFSVPSILSYEADSIPIRSKSPKPTSQEKEKVLKMDQMGWYRCTANLFIFCADSLPRRINWIQKKIRLMNDWDQ